MPFLIGLFLNGCIGDGGGKEPVVEKTVKVVVVTSSQGLIGGLGRQGLEGFEAGRRTLPVLEGGWRIEVEPIDGNASALHPEAVATAVERYGASAVVSIQNSAAVLALGPVAEKHRFPVLAVTATHEDVSRSPWISQMSMSNETEGTVAAFYAHDELFRERAAIVYDDRDPFSVSLASRFSRVFTSLGETVVLEASIRDRSVSELVGQMRERNTDIVYMVLYSRHAARFYAARQRQKWAVDVIGVDGLVGEVAMRRPRWLPSLEGTLVVEHFADTMPRTEMGRQAAEALKDAGLKPSAVRYLGFEAYSLLALAVGACGNDAVCINAFLRDSPMVDGVGGRFRIANGRAERPAFINRVEDGKMKMLVKIY
jgi:branched-chain amino acid transport system substrate-binding protein